MRLDNDASIPLQSPSQSRSNGSAALSPGRSGKISNGDSYNAAESNGSTEIFTNGNSTNNGTTLQKYFGHDREQVTRLLIQSLTDLGYHGAARTLCQESGCQLENPTVAAFRHAVLSGSWNEAEALLFGTSYDDAGGVGLDEGSGILSKSHGKAVRLSWSPSRRRGGLELAEGANENEMKFRMRQQKYLELLEGRDLGAALIVLRQELTPLHQDVRRLHLLSSFMMCDSAADLREQALWDGAQGNSRKYLLSELSRSISPNVMIPEHRLSVLLDQIKETWISNCLYHNTASSPSLYLDHECSVDDFPRRSIIELRQHSDEVWYLRFSNDGTKLATASKDKTIVIYETTTYKVLHTLTEHESGVCFVAWSPDDTKLISCAQWQDSSARVWDVQTGVCLLRISEPNDPVTSAAWAPDGMSFVIGSQDSSHPLSVYDLTGTKIHSWKEDHLRVHDLAISPDGQHLVVLLKRRIQVYDFISRQKVDEYKLDDIMLTSVNISKDNTTMLISMNENKIQMMDIRTGECLQTYDGQRQMQYIVRSAFGGANENFVVSGSEDSRVYIWRTNGILVEALEGHTGCVNAVSWHPTEPSIFASAGDDRKVRIWASQNHLHRLPG